jgi:hypothetical protein
MFDPFCLINFWLCLINPLNIGDLILPYSRSDSALLFAVDWRSLVENGVETGFAKVGERALDRYITRTAVTLHISLTSSTPSQQ